MCPPKLSVENLIPSETASKGWEDGPADRALVCKCEDMSLDAQDPRRARWGTASVCHPSPPTGRVRQRQENPQKFDSRLAWRLQHPPRRKARTGTVGCSDSTQESLNVDQKRVQVCELHSLLPFLVWFLTPFYYTARIPSP